MARSPSPEPGPHAKVTQQPPRALASRRKQKRFFLTLDSEAVRCGWRGGEAEQGSPLMTQTTLSLQPVTESCGSRWQPSGLSMPVISSFGILEIRTFEADRVFFCGLFCLV